MKLSFRLLIFVLLLPVITGMTHKYYVSKTLLHYEAQESLMEITTQIFIDDLELELRSIHNEPLKLKEDDEHPSAEQWLEDYLNDNLILNINGRKQKLNYLGSELEGETLYCYLEIPNLMEINSMTIENSILFENFEDQRNIVDLEFPDWERRIILNLERSREIIF